MAGFRNHGERVAASLGGQSFFAPFRKVPSQNVASAGECVDLSMAAGNPPGNFYPSTPLVAATIDPARAIYCGEAQSPATKWVDEFCLCVAVAAHVAPFWLCDYLIYYPFIDLDDTSEQVLDNTVGLPRYADGDGVRAILVVTAPTVGGGSFTFTYVNQDGETRTSPVVTAATTAANIGTLVGSRASAANMIAQPFLPLASGDSGIRSITSVTPISAMGGNASLVLVKSLLNVATRETNMTQEWPIARMGQQVQVLDGATLALIERPSGSISGFPVVGHIQVTWG